MARYIDAEKLKRFVESIGLTPQKSADYNDGRDDVKMRVLDFIDSLQQERPESSNGKFVFPNFLYARTVDNKTIDVSYAPQSMDAVEYIKNDSTEQPEVDLEKEIRSMWEKCNPTDEGMGVESTYMHIEAFDIIVRHFFNLGLKARNQ